ncbi:MAG: TfoX/Sxy family protein [Catenulispora sp.]
MSDTRARFAELVARYLGVEDVTCPGTEPGARGFGRGGLKVNGKLFAMVSQDRLVLKLPADRIDRLLAAGAGDRFDPRKNGVEMREWLMVDPDSDVDWELLAEEARTFVAAGGA